MVIISFSNANNAFSITPQDFVQSTVHKAAITLGSNLSKEEKINKLKEIAKETVDINGIGFYSLGVHRKSLTKRSNNNL